MTSEKVLNIIREYRAGLLAAGNTAERHADVPLTYVNAREHILYMCDEMLKIPTTVPGGGTSAMSIEKQMRWLGFIQGVFAMLGATVEELKDTNRPTV